MMMEFDLNDGSWADYHFSDDDQTAEDNQFLEEGRHVLKNENRNLGLSENYVPTWDTRDAFGEFYQNW